MTAKDKGTGKEQSITIQGSSGLSKDEVEKMRKEAEAHADEDKKKREGVEAKNHLESAIYQAEKLKSDNKDKISEDDQKTLDDAIAEAKKVAEKDDADKDAFEAAAKELTDKMMPIGAKLYEAANADKQEGDAAGEDAKKDGDDPIEGEVVDEK